MDCKICFDKFNKFERQPIIAIPCGHTICEACLKRLKLSSLSTSELRYTEILSVKCPTCRQTIRDEKPNFTVLELLDYNLIVDTNADLKQEINDLHKTIKTAKMKLSSDCINKINETKTKVQSVKEEIYKRTEKLIDLLISNQNILLSEAETFGIEINQSVRNILRDYTKEISAKDLSQLNKTELECYKSHLSCLNTSLISKSKEVNETDCKIEFKSNDTFFFNMIGTVSSDKSKDQRHEQLLKTNMQAFKTSLNDKLKIPLSSSLNSTFSLNFNQDGRNNERKSNVSSLFDQLFLKETTSSEHTASQPLSTINSMATSETTQDTFKPFQPFLTPETLENSSTTEDLVSSFFKYETPKSASSEQHRLLSDQFSSMSPRIPRTSLYGPRNLQDTRASKTVSFFEEPQPFLFGSSYPFQANNDIHRK